MVPHLTSGGDKLSTHHELPCLEKDGEGKQILIHDNRPIVEKSMSKEHQFIKMLSGKNDQMVQMVNVSEAWIFGS
jgi:hypothetical protein